VIDLKYHISSIVAIFLALGLGILIGSSIVGDNLLIEQQKKMIDRLEEQFYVFQEREAKLEADNKKMTDIINNYENYSQAVLPLLVNGRLEGYKAALIVTGDSEVPAGMVNALSAAGVEIVSNVVVLAHINLDSEELRNRLIAFYNLDSKTDKETLRHYVATSVAALISGVYDPGLVEFLEGNNLVKFKVASFGEPINGVIVLGGANNINNYYVESFDQGLIQYLNGQGIRVFGVEPSTVQYSYMSNYQENNISTIDNIDYSPGQISLIMAMEGEAGHYGIKDTAKKFMPSLPLKQLGEGN